MTRRAGHGRRSRPRRNRRRPLPARYPRLGAPCPPARPRNPPLHARARRYRLTRTIFRGARFWMTGSGLVYLLRYLGWAFLSLVTVGLAYPWMVASLERYKMRNTFYGDLRGAFDARAGTFFKRGILLW